MIQKCFKECKIFYSFLYSLVSHPKIYFYLRNVYLYTNLYTQGEDKENLSTHRSLKISGWLGHFQFISMSKTYEYDSTTTIHVCVYSILAEWTGYAVLVICPFTWEGSYSEQSCKTDHSHPRTEVIFHIYQLFTEDAGLAIQSQPRAKYKRVLWKHFCV